MDLKGIVNKLHLVKNNNDRIYWINLFIKWYDQNKSYINEQNINLETGRKWFKHKDLRRTAIMIKRAIPNMFHYIENPQIPNNTNSIESFFENVDILNPSNIGIRIVYFLFSLFINLSLINHGFIFLKL